MLRDSSRPGADRSYRTPPGRRALVLLALTATAALAGATTASAAPHSRSVASATTVGVSSTSATSTSTAGATKAGEATKAADAGKAGSSSTAAAGAVPASAVAKPILGWSSASLQSTRDATLNPRGRFSWLDEPHVLQQATTLSTRLKRYGYQYVNLDAGWWMSWDWQPRYDANGRQVADPKRFPHGMKSLADRIHRLGLKAGLYLPAGLEKPAYGGGTVPIAGAPGCTTKDAVFADLRTTNGWDSSYQLDFSRPCAKQYVDSQAQLIAGWGFDLLKLDGVGPGSGHGGGNYDNVADVAAWRAALDATGRTVHLDLAWALDPGHATDWQRYANSWRIDTDVECYCRALTTWDNSVDDRFADAPAWSPYPGGNLDSLDVGNGRMDGLTDAERRSYATLWAIEGSPLVTGDDLTRLDPLGVALLTNREVLAIDQQGVPARPVTPAGDAQVWGLRNGDGSYTVALFNLGSAPATVTAYWSSFGFGGRAAVRDVWDRKALGDRSDGIGARLPAHGSRLFRVVPRGTSTAPARYEAEAPGNTLTAPAGVTGCDACSGGQKVGNLYGGGAVTFTGVRAPRAGIYQVNVTYTTGDPRGTDVSANGGPVTHVDYPVSGGWGTPATVTVPVRLNAGLNAITFGSGSGYSPDLDAIAVPGKESGR